MSIPTPVIKQRLTNEDLYKKALNEKGVTSLQAKIIANRDLPEGTDIHGFMNPSLSNIPPVSMLKDIQKAGNRIADAIIAEEDICLACDFDVDGISSAAVMYKAIVDLFGYNKPNKVTVCISNRMKEGYGFNAGVVERILMKDPIPSLVVTADQGSSNQAEIKQFIDETRRIASERKTKTQRITREADVIVSDHHEIPTSGGPESAYAFVNPQRLDDEYPDKTICGCTVAMFVMASVRQALIKKGHLDSSAPTIKPLMAYSTAATISDCVSMASQINRAIVRHGLNEINNETLPAWKAMKELCITDETQPVLAESIGFGLGPMINACSRTGGDGLNAVRYYLAETDADAQRYLSFLTVDNDIRKGIEKRLVEEAVEKSIKLVEQGFYSLVIPLKNGHHGIHGIAASRIVERFGRPTIILSPKQTHKEILEKPEVEQLLGFRLDLTKLEDFYDVPNSNSFITHTVEKGYQKKKKYTFFKETIVSMSGSGRSIDGLGEDQKGQLNLLGCMIEANEKESIKIKEENEKKNPVVEPDPKKKTTKKQRDELAKQKREADVNNKMFLGFGGHHMAAGMGLQIGKVKNLKNGIEEAVRSKIDKTELYPKVWTDGEIPDGYEINEAFVDEIGKLEPYGRQFDYPTFTIEAEVINLEIKGKNADTGIFELKFRDKRYKGVFFKYTINAASNFVAAGGTYRFVVAAKFNYFRKRRTVQLMISHAEEI